MNTRLPVFFFSHGSPMHAVEPSAAAQAWQAAVAQIPSPPAILMVSAHWESESPLLTGAETPETIHDFGGFPEALYRIRYPAPGSPELASQALGLLREAGFAAAVDVNRGLDHGAWVPLLKMYPRAEVPVVQLSIQPRQDAAHHFALGAALAPLRECGVLIVASGHMTHNLRDWFAQQGAGEVVPYAREFRDWVDSRVRSGALEDLLAWASLAPHARRAHPSVEHFLPLFVALGAAGTGYTAESLCAGYDGSVLAMDAYRFD